MATASGTASPARKRLSGSRADAVASSVRTDILAGRLEPGRRLTFPELCPAYSVSVGVLREALTRLVDQGLVRAESNQGFSVISLSPDDLEGLAQVRISVEPVFVFQSVSAGTVKWESEVIAAHHRLERAPVHADDGARLSDDWVDAHAQFHYTLISASGNRRMYEITRRLRCEMDMYQRWFLDPEYIDQHAETSAAQHRALVDAAVSRDAALTQVLLRDHIKNSADTMLRQGPVGRVPGRSPSLGT